MGNVKSMEKFAMVALTAVILAVLSVNFVNSLTLEAADTLSEQITQSF